MAALGEFLNDATEHLARAGQALPPDLPGGQARDIAVGLLTVLDQAHAYAPTGRAADTRLWQALLDADRHIRQAHRRYAVQTQPCGAPGEELRQAADALRGGHALLTSHQGAEHEATTIYRRLVITTPARRYITARLGELAENAGQLAQRLASRTDDPGTLALWAEARGALDHAAQVGRATADTATPAMALLPQAPLLTPEPAPTADSPTALPQHINAHLERISRGVFEAARGLGPHTISGSDLQQLGRSMALGHLLNGRLLLHLAETQPPPLAETLRHGAAQLREAAQAWQTATAAWHHTIDISDPREHPALPRWSYPDKRAGRAVNMPNTPPHPATIDAHTAAVRSGRILFGGDFDPAAGIRPQPRPAPDILADAAGLPALLAGAYRMPAVGGELAQASALLIRRAAPTLITDQIEHRPPELDERLRMYPLHGHQLQTLTAAYIGIGPAEERAAAAVLTAARSAGLPLPRAELDAAVRAAATPPNRQAPTDSSPHRSIASAATARSTTTTDRTVPPSPSTEQGGVRHDQRPSPQPGRERHR